MHKNNTTMARKTLTFALLALLAFTVMPAYGQETAPTGRFDWARSIHTGSTLSCIRGTATDPEGNLYALVYAGPDGRFTADASGDGQSLMPAEANGQGGQGCIVALLKISPQGDLLWEKAIKNGWGGQSEPANMRLMGDTAVACMVTFGLAWDHGNWLYYIDTMIRDLEGNPVEWGDFQSQFVTAWLSFDLDGNLKESHFLRLSYLDSLGNDIVHPTTGDKYCDYLRYVTFDVAADGSIYIIHFPTSRIDDDHTAEDGGIHSTRVWVDNRLVGTMPAHSLVYQPQLLKFAPHFDTLLAQRYVVQSCDVDTSAAYPGLILYEHMGPIHVGPDGDIYWATSIDARYIHNVTFDQQPEYTIQTEMRPAAQNMIQFMSGLLFKFDSALNIQYLFYLDDAVMNPSRWFNNSYFHDVTFDTDSGLVFLYATAERRAYSDTTSNNSFFAYDGDTLTDLNNAFFMILREESNHPVLHSYGMLPATRSGHHTGDTWDSWSNDKIAVGRNRVFAQAYYSNKLYLPNQTVQLPNASTSYKGLCLAVYDYAGHCLYGIDYGSTCPDSGPVGALLRDSVLYLTNDLYGEAHFGTHGGYYSGHNATIARYVDTSFMSTYIYTGDSGEVSITLVEGGNAFVAYPNPFRQRINIKVQNSDFIIKNCYLTDLSGRREEVRLTPDGPGQYSLDLSARPQATYLLTLTTADGKQHTVRLLKQSDIFGQ